MRTAKTLIRLGRYPGWTESLLGAQSFCWFCHVVAHFCFAWNYTDGQKKLYWWTEDTILMDRRNYTDGQKILYWWTEDTILMDRRYPSVNPVLYAIHYALLMIRCNGSFMHVKLTLYAKECKLSLEHMQTEYHVTVMQTSNCHWLFLYYEMFSCFLSGSG